MRCYSLDTHLNSTNNNLPSCEVFPAPYPATQVRDCPHRCPILVVLQVLPLSCPSYTPARQDRSQPNINFYYKAVHYQPQIRGHLLFLTAMATGALWARW